MQHKLWEQLAQELQAEQAILGPRNSPTRLRTLYEHDRAACLYNDAQDRIIAYTALWDTEVPDWYEFGSLWVAPDYRGTGLARTLFAQMAAKCMPNMRVFLITHNDKVVHLAQGHGYRELAMTQWHAVPWAATCGPCDRFVTVHEKMQCPYKAVAMECRLFVK